ncbi:MAG: hypothetical protein LBQ60_04555 [Bacteroidales bacterium]|jgi:hypothetical protein|nr:hypothetical protein [Bacteroidales bacterium]
MVLISNSYDSKEITHFFESLKKYLLIDSLSVSNVGLAGKAGAALTLFELSEEDAFLENYAVEFLQESLLFPSDDFSYQGVIGVGMILRYLIENKFIDADFFDLFGEIHVQVVDQVLSQTYLKEHTFDYLLYFLLSTHITDSEKEKCIDLLVANISCLINNNYELQKKGHFISKNYNFLIKDELQFSCKKNHSDLLIDKVDGLFQAISSKSDVDEIIDTILHMKLDFNEKGFNLAISRLLVLFTHFNRIPPNLLFFFY